MENKINNSSVISLSLLTLISFMIFITFFAERPEIAVTTIQNNQSTNQIVTQEQGDNKKIRTTRCSHIIPRSSSWT